MIYRAEVQFEDGSAHAAHFTSEKSALAWLRRMTEDVDGVMSMSLKFSPTPRTRRDIIKLLDAWAGGIG